MLNPIRIVFQNVIDGIDRTDYINARLGLLIQAYETDQSAQKPTDPASIVSKEHHAALVHLVSISQFPKASLANTGEHPTFDTNQQLIADERIECAFNTIQTINPLLPGEHITSQTKSYLAAPYLGYTARTGIIRQVTNMAILYFFFLDCKIENKGDVIWVPPRDRQQKQAFQEAIGHLPNGCQHKIILSKKINRGLKHLIPIPYNSLAVV